MIYGNQTRIMGVIGDPIEHSLSPFLHGSVIENCGLDAVYLPFRVSGSETARFHDAARYLGFAGYNATMPHKLNLMDLVEELDDSARRFGAVNTVRFRDGVARGYNTDVDGLLLALRGQDFVVRGARIMMIGAGGVAGALAQGFCDAGADRVAVLNRTEEKAKSILEKIRLDRWDDLPGHEDGRLLAKPVLEAYSLGNDALRCVASESDLIVNCTPLGMTGIERDFEDLSFLDDTDALVCDLIYNPWKTRLLSYAEARGLRVMNGIDMLLYQGFLAFSIFTDIPLDMEAEFRRIYPLCEAKLRR